MQHWGKHVAEGKLMPLMQQLQLEFYRDKFVSVGAHKVMLTEGKNGVKLSAHKNTWKRKREDKYLICIEYFIRGERLLYHVEPWVSFPSDFLIAKMMLLPREVNDAALAT